MLEFTLAKNMSSSRQWRANNLRWCNERRCIYQSCDTLTNSGHRRKGLFQLLARHTYPAAQAADPCFSALGFGGPTSTPGFVKMGWQVASRSRTAFAPFL